MIRILFGLIFSFQFFSLSSYAKDKGEFWKALPVQHQGRVKPFDTFSREILNSVHGRSHYKGKSAVHVILSWILIPDHWEKVPFVLVKSLQIKEALGLDPKKMRFAPKDFQFNKRFGSDLLELQALRQREEERDSYFKELEKLEGRLLLYESIKGGWLLKVQPGEEQKEWIPLKDLKGESQKLFREALLSYAHLLSQKVQDQGKGKSAFSIFKRNGVLKKTEVGVSQNKDFSKKNSVKEKSLKESLKAFNRSAFKGEPEKWYSSKKISAEVFYNTLNPFRWAWIFYFIFLFSFAFLFLIQGRKKSLKWLLLFVFAGFSIHTLGMGLRSYIMSRPPVSNMYETVLWVPWVGLIGGFFFYWRKVLPSFIASIIAAFFCLLLTDMAPQVLDGSLQPLEAVLRSNFWLSTHVLIITMSYAFFFVAFVLGDMVLLSFLFRKEKGLTFMKESAQSIYRLMQWGVGGLALGTVLGAVWADYSWGRFWGWDPKESWALITLLGYLAVLHGRLLGWIKAFGMAVSAVGMFFLVVMAWYGVNFILGKGLHSYGFGTGGVEYVAGFFLLHLLLCVLAFFKKKLGRL